MTYHEFCKKYGGKTLNHPLNVSTNFTQVPKKQALHEFKPEARTVHDPRIGTVDTEVMEGAKINHTSKPVQVQ